jgi:hypothetical protein
MAVKGDKCKAVYVWHSSIPQAGWVCSGEKLLQTIKLHDTKLDKKKPLGQKGQKSGDENKISELNA